MVTRGPQPPGKPRAQNRRATAHTCRRLSSGAHAHGLVQTRPLAARRRRRRRLPRQHARAGGWPGLGLRFVVLGSPTRGSGCTARPCSPRPTPCHARPSRPALTRQNDPAPQPAAYDLLTAAGRRWMSQTPARCAGPLAALHPTPAPPPHPWPLIRPLNTRGPPPEHPKPQQNDPAPQSAAYDLLTSRGLRPANVTPPLDESDARVLRWAANSATVAAPRHATRLQYKNATAFEVLVSGARRLLFDPR